MTPDMKRLCEAAASVSLAGESVHDTNEQIYERIVRAVLVALREPSAAMREAANNTGWEDDGWRRESWDYEHGAVIDFILDTKARRADALQDLADIDRDLL